MRKIVKNIFYVLLLVVTTACTDLKENVYDKLPADKFGSTLEELDAIVGPAYITLKDLTYIDHSWGWADLTGDAMIAPTRGGDWWDDGEWMEMCMHTWTPTSYGIDQLWSSCMDAITTINSIYSVVEPSTAMTPDLKAQIVGEIRGLRAFWYYQLIDFFGNVPIVTDFSDLTPPVQSTRKEVYDFIVSELKDIIPNLRSDVSDASYGKFTKGAAFTLLAKMYLNAQEWTGTANWEGAAEACDSVMNLGYIIEPDWKINFAVHNEVSKEAIFPIVYSANDDWDVTGINGTAMYTLDYSDPEALGFESDAWNGICAMPDFVKSFDPNDKRGMYSNDGSQPFLVGDMINPKNNKKLYTHNIDLTVKKSSYPDPWGDVGVHDGARISKWTFDKAMMNTYMENDMFIFRLADVYLMKAEALVRMGGDNAEATRLVNVIRERAFGDSKHDYSSVTLNNIYNERGWELAYEFCRRQDMIRFQTYLLPRYMKPKTSSDFRKLMPIPFTAWQKNNNLVQNPGYSAF